MSKLTLKTDGKELQDLRALYERQLDALRAAKTHESAKRAENEKAGAAHKSALSDWMKSVSRTNHEVSPELEAADAAVKRTRSALEVAEVESKSLGDAAARTAVAIVAQTVADNLGALEGKTIRYKRTLTLINDALPSPLYVRASYETWARENLIVSVHRWTGENDEIILDGAMLEDAFRREPRNVTVAAYGDEEISGDELHKRMELGHYAPGAEPADIAAQVAGYRAALAEAREQIAELDRKRAEAIERYKTATSCLRGTADVSKR